MTPSAIVDYYEFGGFRLDVANHQLLKDDEVIPLTQKSYKILHYLVKNKGKVISKDELIEKFWDETYVEETNLVQHIYRIRKALRDEENDETYIETISKLGYKFAAPVDVILQTPKINGQNGITNGYKTQNGNGNYVKVANEQNNFTPQTLVDTPQIIKEKGTTKTALHPKSNGNNRRKFFLATSIIASIIILFGSYYFFADNTQGNPEKIDSIAILPFEQIGEDKDEKLGLGVADTLISRLSNQKKITVSPTTTIIKFLEEGNKNPFEIGKKLDVDAVLTGTIQRDGELVRVNMQLMSVKYETPIWSEKFDSTFSDIFSLQDKVSEHIAKRLSVETENNQGNYLVIKNTKNIDAYKAFSKGLYYWDKRDPEDLKKALEYFQEATEKDSNFAKAYAYLSDTYAVIGNNKYDLMPEKEAIQKAKETVDTALAIDPNSAEAFTALGLIKTYEKDLGEAHRLLNKAIELQPNNSTAYMRLAWVFALEGNLEESVNKMTLAYKTNPQSIMTIKNFSFYLYLTRKTDEAIALSQRVLENMPPSDDLNLFLAETYEQKQDYSKALDEINTVITNNPNNHSAKFSLARVYAKIGRLEEAEKIRQELIELKAHEKSPYELAMVDVNLKKYDETIKTLKQIPAGDMFLMTLKNDYNLDEIKNMPKFKAFVRTIERQVKN